MTQAEHFNECMKMAGLENEYQSEKATPVYNDAILFLIDAGIPEDKVKTEATVGCVARYILDTYSYGAGDVKLSPFLLQRVKQLQARFDKGEQDG